MSTSDDSVNGEERQTTKVSEKGQATIPQTIREEYGIEPGDEVEWVDEGDGVKLRRHTESSGYGAAFPDATEEEREAIAQQLEDDLREKRRGEWDPRENPPNAGDR